jgi:hypothetical protein
MTSCSKEEHYEVKGTVLDLNSAPVISAKVQIFKNPEDWLTGHNVIATMQSDMLGEFVSPKIFEAGDYYIFVEKYDTSNWNIRDVERGVFPKITLPLENGTTQIVEQNNMRLLANTNWKLTNILREFTKPDVGTIQWNSTWSTSNNCEKDNELYFGKDLTLRVSEGNYICAGTERNTLGSFVPPMIFTSLGCEQLLHTSQKVKPFEYSNWPEMETKQGKMYLACDQSVGQLYVIYKNTPTTKKLLVYSKY